MDGAYGPTGVTGAAGSAGATGATGATGTAGSQHIYVATSAGGSLSSPRTVSLTAPTGQDYAVSTTGTALAISPGTAITCTLSAGSKLSFEHHAALLPGVPAAQPAGRVEPQQRLDHTHLHQRKQVQHDHQHQPDGDPGVRDQLSQGDRRSGMDQHRDRDFLGAGPASTPAPSKGGDPALRSTSLFKGPGHARHAAWRRRGGPEVTASARGD